jgi:hypothetical protein
VDPDALWAWQAGRDGDQTMQKTTVAAKLRSRPAPRDNNAKRVGAALALPKANHTSSRTPMVERFVFDADDQPLIEKTWNDADRDTLLNSARLPLPTCWLELGEHGYFVKDGFVYVYVSAGNHVFSLIRLDFSVVANATGTLPIEFYDFGEHLRVTGTDWSYFRGLVVQFAMMCCILASPTAATVERIHGNADYAAGRESRRRRAQRGYPVFSFNKVKMRRPDTSKQSSDLLLHGPQTSKRGHWVVGHWRLVDGNAEPYWTWVDAHKRGEEALGFVAHERHVEIAPGSFGTRRGFVIPTMPGQPGTRLPAQRG